MDTYLHLHPQLEQFEDSSFRSLTAGSLPSSLPATAIHGGIQFVSVMRCGNFPSTQKVPVITAVGINYTQKKTGITFPHLQRYLTDKSRRPTIEDKAPGTERALDKTLAAHTRNLSTWVTDGRSSGSVSLSGSTGYILVAINFVPFITTDPWLKLKATERCGLLHFSTGLSLLGPLHALLSGSVDLWVGHGKTVVWPLFQHWLVSTKAKNWMMTHNLSGLGCISMTNAQKNSHNPDHQYFK